MSIFATVTSTSPEHWWHWVVACTPFLTVVNGKARVNTGMIIQALIVAGVGGAIVAYINLSKLEVKFDAIMDEIIEIKQDVKDIRKDFYKPRLP